MHIVQGSSHLTDGEAAVAEATAGWPSGEAAPEVVFAFCSTAQPAPAVARALSSRFPSSLVVGCTTAGEILSGSHYNGSLVAMGLSSPDLRFSAALVPDLGNVTSESLRATVDGLFARLGFSREALDPARHFALLFIDGLSRKEEVFVSLLDDALEGLPLAGGSAGDDLRFERTEVFVGGECASDAAVVVVGRSELPFALLKHQHFRRTPRSLVITSADPEKRVVREMDGLPAVEAYARALGVRPEEVDEELASVNPVTLRVDGELFVRSVQRILPDGGLVFYCAIEEGMVLEIGGHEDMRHSLEDELRSFASSLGAPQLFLAANCILRSLEATKRGLRDDLARVLDTAFPNVVGFDTYGEQTGGLHVNQTLVGIAFGRKAG